MKEPFEPNYDSVIVFNGRAYRVICVEPYMDRTKNDVTECGDLHITAQYDHQQTQLIPVLQKDERMTTKLPEHGEWWIGSISECIVYVHGTTKLDMVMFEEQSGTWETTHKSTFIRRYKHLPECTGFDWKPDQWPKYVIDNPPVCSWGRTILIKRLSPTSAVLYTEDGTEIPYCWTKLEDSYILRYAWKYTTKEVGEARLPKPKPPEYKPTTQRVPLTLLVPTYLVKEAYGIQALRAVKDLTGIDPKQWSTVKGVEAYVEVPIQ